MRSLSGLNILRRKGTLLYRGIRYRRGFGVHSPFVYNLITKVIEERCPYYSFQDIELYRKQLSHKMDPITYPDWRNKGRLRCRTVAEIVRREAVKPKLGALLFRLANYFKARNILQIGTTMGISTLYLTSYSTDLRCIALENIPGFATIARQAFEKKARNPIDLRVGGYKESLPQALKDLGNVDLVFFNTLYEPQNNRWLFQECLRYAHNETVFVFKGINANQRSRELWKEICETPEVTVTLDLYSLGIVLFNKKLYKKDYIAYF